MFKLEESIKNKIKETDISELITEEQLSELVHKAIQEIFFDNVKKKNNYGDVIKETPSEFKLMIKELLKEDVNNIFKDYLEENKEEILKIIKEVLSNNISILLANAFKYHFQDVLISFEQNIIQKMENI